MAKVPSFEWDEEKDRVNRRKHGVSFDQAQYAFFDPNRIVAEDLSRSGDRVVLLLLWLGGRRSYDGAIYVSRRPHSHLRSGLLAERKENL